jgi:hypothetical protein
MVAMMQGRLLVLRLALTDQVKTLTPTSQLEPETLCPPRVGANRHRSYTRVERAMTVRRRRLRAGAIGRRSPGRRSRPPASRFFGSVRST